MTWISVVCLLALSSSAFGRSVSYGSYGAAQPQVSNMNLARDFSSQPTGYGQQHHQQTFVQQQDDVQEQQQQPILTKPVQTGYGAQQIIRKPLTLQGDMSYGKMQQRNFLAPQPVMFEQQQRNLVSPQQLLLDQQQQLQQKIAESTILTEADILCRGQRPETVIPLENGRKFVVCLDDSKGYEQYCPKGLVYHTETRRCERKLGPLENPCSSQPCLNGGQCVQTDVSSWQCQCAPGFDGRTCELDASVCQSQQPCGQSPDTKCQSFRFGAALQHVCILQNGRAYGLTASQAQANPCNGVDGTFPLAFSDKGFIMCDGESMFVESCPGGTIWDDLNKACVWPDMQGVISFEEKSTKLQGYGQTQIQRPLVNQYSEFQQVKTPVRPILQQQKPIQQDRLSGYGTQPRIQFPVQQQQEDEVEQIQPTLTLQQPQQPQFQLPKTSSYGAQQTFVKPQIFQQPIRQQEQIRPVQQQQSSGY